MNVYEIATKLLDKLVYITNHISLKSNFFFIVTIEDALANPYLNSQHDISDEPICMTPFSLDFERHSLSEEQMELIYQEALAFNPEYQQ